MAEVDDDAMPASQPPAAAATSNTAPTQKIWQRTLPNKKKKFGHGVNRSRVGTQYENHTSVQSANQDDLHQL